MLLAVVLAAQVGNTADSDIADRVRKISQVERRLPWFWSPFVEGLTDIPYTYRQKASRIVKGRQTPNPLTKWRALEMERIPLDWGAFLRCLSEDGRSPCSDEWKRELERQTAKVDSFTAEDRARLDRTRAERRERRRAFWDAFPTALKFEFAGPGEIRFLPLKPGPTLLGAMSGRLWFDPATWRITRLEYTMSRNVDEPFRRLPKGAHFEIALELSADGDYLPRRTRSRDPGHELTVEYSDFKRFESKSTLRFGDQ